MVGGTIIEVAEGEKAFGYPPKKQVCFRLWCIDGYDECAVYVAMPDDGLLPAVGQSVWWQAGTVYWDNDTRTLTKLGNSHDPRNVKD